MITNILGMETRKMTSLMIVIRCIEEKDEHVQVNMSTISNVRKNSTKKHRFNENMLLQSNVLFALVTSASCCTSARSPSRALSGPKET